MQVELDLLEILVATFCLGKSATELEEAYHDLYAQLVDCSGRRNVSD